ncbi:MAG: hypothetical protein ACJ8AT_36320 [Hyalangium sp.]|uniref:hypothetical protein n=1 Tax=Hyalangium sp. TaxID=2028555 RepID=UPI00389A791E
MTDDDERELLSLNRGVGGDRERIGSEVFESFRRSRRVEHPHGYASALNRVLDVQDAAADGHF